LAFAAIYLVVAVLLVWGAGRIANYAVDFRFYRDFLIPWEVRLLEMRHRSFHWPAFKKDHPVAYMQSVVDVMKSNGMQLPKSNTRHAFIYRLNRFGADATKILLVFNDNKITIYGLPSATFERLDQFVDGHADSDQGDLTGQLSRDQITMTGSWKL
jgi:hypothetical protein